MASPTQPAVNARHTAAPHAPGQHTDIVIITLSHHYDSVSFSITIRVTFSRQWRRRMLVASPAHANSSPLIGPPSTSSPRSLSSESGNFLLADADTVSDKINLLHNAVDKIPHWARRFDDKHLVTTAVAYLYSVAGDVTLITIIPIYRAGHHLGRRRR